MMDALMWATLLLVVGLGLIVLELFIPSGGVLGILASLAIIASLVVAFTGGWISGVIMMVTMMIVLPLAIAGAIRWWPHTPMGRMVVLETPEMEDERYPDADDRRSLDALIGRRGTAKSKMLPSGAIVIDGRVYDALAEGMAIEPGQPVRVTAIRTNRLIVMLDDAAPAGPVEDADLLSQPAEPFGIDPLDESPA
jgi:membrane-bound ClpP family serine protease